MTDKTLPQRMREAAESAALSITRLYKLADEWEREDTEKAAAAAALEAEVEELAEWIVNSTLTPWSWARSGASTRSFYCGIARDRIAAGWRKTETS